MTLSAAELTELIKEVDSINVRKKQICEKIGCRDTISFEDVGITLHSAVKERLFYEWQLEHNGAKI